MGKCIEKQDPTLWIEGRCMAKDFVKNFTECICGTGEPSIVDNDKWSMLFYQESKKWVEYTRSSREISQSKYEHTNGNTYNVYEVPLDLFGYSSSRVTLNEYKELKPDTPHIGWGGDTQWYTGNTVIADTIRFTNGDEINVESYHRPVLKFVVIDEEPRTPLWSVDKITDKYSVYEVAHTRENYEGRNMRSTFFHQFMTLRRFSASSSNNWAYLLASLVMVDGFTYLYDRYQRWVPINNSNHSNYPGYLADTSQQIDSSAIKPYSMTELYAVPHLREIPSTAVFRYKDGDFWVNIMVQASNGEQVVKVTDSTVGSYNFTQWHYGFDILRLINSEGSDEDTYSHAIDQSTMYWGIGPEVIDKEEAYKSYERQVNECNHFEPPVIEIDNSSPPSLLYFSKDYEQGWLNHIKFRPGDVEVKFWVSINGRRVAGIVQGDPAYYHDGHYRNLIYLGRTKELDYPEYGMSTNTTEGGKLDGNFALTTGTGEMDRDNTGIIYEDINKKYRELYSGYGKYTSNGMDSVSILRSESGLRYQEYHPAFLTHLPDYPRAGSLPSGVRRMELEKHGFVSSLWTDNVYASPIYLIHPYEGYRSYLEGFVVVPDHNIINMDELELDFGDEIEVYKFFSLKSVVNLFSRSANMLASVAIFMGEPHIFNEDNVTWDTFTVPEPVEPPGPCEKEEEDDEDDGNGDDNGEGDNGEGDNGGGDNGSGEVDEEYKHLYDCTVKLHGDAVASSYDTVRFTHDGEIMVLGAMDREGYPKDRRLRVLYRSVEGVFSYLTVNDSGLISLESNTGIDASDMLTEAVQIIDDVLIVPLTPLNGESRAALFLLNDSYVGYIDTYSHSDIHPIYDHISNQSPEGSFLVTGYVKYDSDGNPDRRGYIKVTLTQNKNSLVYAELYEENYYSLPSSYTASISQNGEYIAIHSNEGIRVFDSSNNELKLFNNKSGSCEFSYCGNYFIISDYTSSDPINFYSFYGGSFTEISPPLAADYSGALDSNWYYIRSYVYLNTFILLNQDRDIITVLKINGSTDKLEVVYKGKYTFIDDGVVLGAKMLRYEPGSDRFMFRVSDIQHGSYKYLGEPNVFLSNIRCLIDNMGYGELDGEPDGGLDGELDGELDGRSEGQYIKVLTYVNGPNENNGPDYVKAYVLEYIEEDGVYTLEGGLENTGLHGGLVGYLVLVNDKFSGYIDPETSAVMFDSDVINDIYDNREFGDRVYARIYTLGDYVNFSTIGDVIRFMKRGLFMQPFELDMSQGLDITGEWGNLGKLEWYNYIAGATHKMIRDSPSIFSAMFRHNSEVIVGVYEEEPSESGVSYGWFNTASADHSDLLIIGINAYGSTSELFGNLENSYNAGLISSNFDEHVVYHEFGHCLHYINVGPSKWVEYTQGYGGEDLYLHYNEDTVPDGFDPPITFKDHVVQFLSEYASYYYPIEFVAEMFPSIEFDILFGLLSNIEPLENAYSILEGFDSSIKPNPLWCGSSLSDKEVVDYF